VSELTREICLLVQHVICALTAEYMMCLTGSRSGLKRILEEY
jgi:hypothetical protein